MTKKKEEFYTGVRVLELSHEYINEIYKKGSIEVPEKRVIYYPNQFIYLKSNDTSDKAGAISVVSKDCKSLHLIRDKDVSAYKVKPKNKEQVMAMHALLDDDIKLVTLTGIAGTGKSLLTICAALQKFDERKYNRIIVTRPMSQVGNYDLGALPGDVDQKFGPYLENYMSNIQQLVGNSKEKAKDLLAMYKVEAMPLQLIRGASWVNTFIIADEVQILDKQEMLTLGTRIGEGSKLVIMGDLNQRDEDIAKIDTGLYHLVNNNKNKDSPLTAHIDLIKSERSELSKLFTEIFPDQ